MPVYEFLCMQCGKAFEILWIKEEELKEAHCPTCLTHDIERLLSRTNIGRGNLSRNRTPLLTSRSCGGGSCSTIDIPGPAD
jgi:putative FmdB family regulatory protein